MSKDNSYDMEFAKRIEIVISKAGGPSEFAKKTGFALPSLYRWQSGADPSRTNLVKIAEATGTDVVWLASGKGNQDSVIAQVESDDANLLNEFNNVTLIQSYDSIHVSAGFGSFNEGVTEADGEEPYSDDLLRALGVKPANAAVFWASGNSMEPTINNGDQLLVDFSRTDIRSNKIYLVQNGSSVWVKRLKMLWSHIELISDNAEEYEPIRIDLDDAEQLQIIGQVVHIGKSVL